MADINLVSITPSQLSGAGEAGQFDVARFSRRYLAQGDSWFSIGHIPPWATTNLLQQMVLGRSAVAVNCARPGVELAHMTDTTSARPFLNLLNGRAQWQWDAILLSGGGNDLIDAAGAAPAADPSLRLLLRPDEVSATATALDYLSDAGWSTFSAHIEAVLRRLLDQRDRGSNVDVPVVLHAYDYVTPRDAPAGPGLGPWLYKSLHDRYQVPPQWWNGVADELIDRMAALWQSLAAKHAARNVIVVDSRGATARAAAGAAGVSGDWENEIHPTAHGYALLAQRWRAVLDALA